MKRNFELAAFLLLIVIFATTSANRVGEHEAAPSVDVADTPSPDRQAYRYSWNALPPHWSVVFPAPAKAIPPRPHTKRLYQVECLSGRYQISGRRSSRTIDEYWKVLTGGPPEGPGGLPEVSLREIIELDGRRCILESRTRAEPEGNLLLERVLLIEEGVRIEIQTLLEGADLAVLKAESKKFWSTFRLQAAVE